MPTLFVIEDDLKLQKYLKEYLTAYEFDVEIINDFDSVLEEVKEAMPDLILLDINLPTFDGFYYVKMLRKHFNIPVIILSARSDEGEQIRGIELGADDYITKPFSIGILLAKIQAVLRRSQATAEEAESVAGELTLQHDSMKLQYKDRQLELSKNEYRLLMMFMQHPNEVISREELLEAIWDDVAFVDDNTLTVNITRVKKKLQECGLGYAISTKRGVGYAFHPAAD
ncbi:response regulator transcription factor [Bacillus sp. 1P06AnD]|uniref:response regulator transcription factor n=1 Tax=Bacillus sp. 1P06AnD TaxID=3132208 RepID=UPI0039A0CCF4